MEKNLQISALLDIYGDLLTEMQRSSLDLYYNEDLSLSEIAEHENISRQGVHDSIKRGEAELLRLENALHLSERLADFEKKLSSIEEILKKSPDFDKKHEALKNICDLQNNL